MFVYKVTNQVNGKVYIGKTTKRNIRIRWREHIQEAERGGKTPFKRALRKYGYDKFVLEPLCEVRTLTELNEEEARFIALYQSQIPEKGYNLTGGGDGGSWWTGKKRSPESIAKMVDTRRRNGTFTLSFTPEAIKNRVASRRANGGYKERIGYKHTSETIEKMKQSAIVRSAKKQEQAKNLYASGLSHPAIAEQMDMSLEFVQKYATV